MKGKIIIVTGGSGLLGKEMVKQLISKSATVINLDKIEGDSNADNVICDLTDDNSVYKAVDQIINKHGQIDGLVNNAYPRTADWSKKFESINPESWRKNVDMQLNSYFVITQKVVEQMKKQKSGTIVNMASIYGVVGNDFTIYEQTAIAPPAAYSAIKGGIINFTKYLASYLGEHGIRVNSLSPGGIFDHQDKTFVANYEKKVPMKRMGTPEDIAPGVIFLLSDDAKYITGHNLIIDGGWTSI